MSRYVCARTARPGETVSGVGYPYLDNIPGTSPTVGTGRVLGHGESPNIPGGGSVIKTDAKVTSGMSGGPLVSASGDGREVLGLTHSTSGGMFSGGPGSFVSSAAIKEELARARMSYVP